ncbi:hypothetical protein BDF20DRAFT_912824 [Mycotypha africana]|uniref:uncharacterized protein n=1 Tax=Mycotypha africana TaxID=64632 RepID=UPI0023000A4C|nr:uncharacterized protein BDF20DRAFT_912824 [Mycotypha africana]KAI8979198.1 hypothetical protein BDF20DRAFT_912824 [Mycotypha africana]
MGDLTEAEKRERRRQKRQQRILNSSEDRLSKITGTAFPHRASPSPVPSPSISSKTDTPLPSKTSQRRFSHSDDPSDELGAPAPLNNGTNTDAMANLLQQQMASMFGSSSSAEPDSIRPVGFDRDPLEQLFASANSSNNNTGLNPANMLAQMMMMNGNSGTTNSTLTPEQLQQQQQEVNQSRKYWNLLHLLIMITLSLFAVYKEWSFFGASQYASLLTQPYKSNYSLNLNMPLFWYFVTIELCLQTARLFYQKGRVPPTSTIATLANQLPPPFSSIINIIFRYKLIWTTFIHDICILIFIIGISQVISNVM